MNLADHLERLLQTQFRKKIWRPFTEALDRYALLSPNDKIAVGISGGKDSMLLYLLLRVLQKHSRFPFDLCAIAMDPGYSPENRDQLLQNCKALQIPVDYFEKPVFRASERLSKARSEHESPCFLCARMRRGALYERAKSQNANKLALGHHLDDAIETILLNVLYAGNYMAMMPKLPADHFEDLTLVRPLYLIEEAHILEFVEASGLRFLNCACTVAAQKTASKRREIKQLIAALEAAHPGIRQSIFRSAQNVHFDAVLGGLSGGDRVSFEAIFQRNADRQRLPKLSSSNSPSNRTPFANPT